MITVKKSSNLSIGSKQTGASAGTASSKQNLGTTSRTKAAGRGPSSADSEFTSLSSSGTHIGGMGPNVSISSNPITLDLDPMLTGITPTIEHQYFYRLFRDIYYQDPVAGSAVDLISSLPFSEFSLGGLPNAEVASTFHSTLERLNMRTLLPEISVDYLVLGSHTSSLLFNNSKKQFTDIMPHDIENLTMQVLPFYSQDPIINVKFPSTLKDLLALDTPRMQRIKGRLGQAVIDKITSGSLELDSLSTLYIPRKTFSTTDLGTSYFKRILPIYLIEKNLFRGTLMESARRQRGIMHITLGDGDQWEPSVADMEFITDLFMNADSDPLGSIIATRMGVATEEIRQGGEFWKVTDFADSVLPHKYRALGISEGLLSGDSNFNTSDNSLTVFIDMIRTFRDMMTRKLFYDKLFPLVSMLNGYTMTTKGKLSIKENLINDLDPEEALRRMQDGSSLLIPSVTWAKQLKPAGDTAYLELLNGLTEKGLPVPLRVIAAAGGMNLDELLKQQDDDLSVRKRVAEYMTKLAALTPKAPEESSGDGDGDGDDTSEASALIALASTAPVGSTRSDVHAQGGRIPILSRKFGAASEVTDISKTGKIKMVHNQKRANERINLGIVRAMRRARERGEFSK